MNLTFKHLNPNDPLRFRELAAHRYKPLPDTVKRAMNLARAAGARAALALPLTVQLVSSAAGVVHALVDTLAA
jgi:hypothetical protein